MTLAVTFFTPASFERSPQVGTRDRPDWGELCEWLSTPTIGTRKDIAGGWCSAHFEGDARRKALVREISGLGLDFDDGAPLAAIAGVLARHRVVIHSTFSSTPAKPKHRAFLPFGEPLTDACDYDRVWRAVVARLGLRVDRGTKDASRLWYAPVVRPDAEFAIEVIEGEPLDPRRVLATLPPEVPREPVNVAELTHPDGYIEGAMRRAAAALAQATEGERHDILNREAFSLARLGLSTGQISSALRGVALSVMGAAREREIDRTISDAVRARGAA